MDLLIDLNDGLNVMVPRIYAAIWFVVLATAGTLYFTGNMSDVARSIFGFIFATLFFGFFVAVLPWWVDRIFQPKYHRRNLQGKA